MIDRFADLVPTLVGANETVTVQLGGSAAFVQVLALTVNAGSPLMVAADTFTFVAVPALMKNSFETG